MKQTKQQQINNLSTEFGKLLLMLKDKFPDAYKYYKSRLTNPDNSDNVRKKAEKVNGELRDWN